MAAVAERDDGRQQRVIVACAALALLAPVIAALILPAMEQPASYHNFADQRMCGRVPHALNVLSNLPFLIVGVLGLSLFRAQARTSVSTPSSLWAYRVLFAGVALTAFGSGYYHSNPSHATLVWDRLPMAIGFSGLVAGTLADRGARYVGPLLVALMVVSVGSVFYWSGTGNLVPYLVMQGAFVAAALAATALVPSSYTHAGWVYGALAVYALAIVCERFDWEIFLFLRGTVSGHTIKHLVAAAAIGILYVMLRTRRPRSAATQSM